MPSFSRCVMALPSSDCQYLREGPVEYLKGGQRQRGNCHVAERGFRSQRWINSRRRLRRQEAAMSDSTIPGTLFHIKPSDVYHLDEDNTARGRIDTSLPTGPYQNGGVCLPLLRIPVLNIRSWAEPKRNKITIYPRSVHDKMRAKITAVSHRRKLR